ncbi:MAG: hypothetical protein NDI60_11600 [Elusimicrobiales bacterium]|nr:hypothetical protein [Elusimicrobiales bacterium]
MKKTKLPLLISALLLAGLGPVFAASPAPVYDFLADLGAAPAWEIAVSTPTAAADDRAYEKPRCKPSDAILPGKTFSPRVSDERRVRAINDLLARIAVCTPMPYDNDGNVHSKPHNGLPAKPSGYYLEYTLIVPNRPTGAKPEPVVIGGVTYMTGAVLSPRGPERLMIGDHREVYYTPDHYTTFVYLDIVR